MPRNWSRQPRDNLSIRAPRRGGAFYYEPAGVPQVRLEALRLRFCARVLLRATGNVADPQGAHELQAWKSVQIVGVPLPQFGVLRVLADDRVLHESVAEVVDHSRDGECATETVVKSWFRHGLSPYGLIGS
jgi:hypothetical protein